MKPRGEGEIGILRRDVLRWLKRRKDEMRRGEEGDETEEEGREVVFQRSEKREKK